jgi:hypothetical protein
MSEVGVRGAVTNHRAITQPIATHHRDTRHTRFEVKTLWIMCARLENHPPLKQGKKGGVLAYIKTDNIERIKARGLQMQGEMHYIPGG